MAMTLITTNTSSGAATSDFTSSIDSTYKLYIFKFIDINPATDSVQFTFQANANGQTDYNETMTSTHFWAYQLEDDSTQGINYNAGQDQAQGTAYQPLAYEIGAGSDENLVGELHLFNPSNTTYVKHFYTTVNCSYQSGFPASTNQFAAGYFNTTTAIDEISFKMSSGNFDGIIKMYGVG